MKSVRQFALWFLMGTVVGGVVIFALTSPRFAIKRVRFMGADFLPADLLALYRSQWTGYNFFCMRTAEAKRLFEAQPKVASITIRRKFPDTLEVIVRERQPFALVMGGGRAWVIDRDGMVYDEAVPEVSVLPRLWWAGETSLKLGQRLPEAVMRSLREALEIADAAGLPPIKKVFLSGEGMLSLSTWDDTLITVGTQAALEERIWFVKAALEQMSRAGVGVAHIDVSTPQGAVWKPRRTKDEQGARTAHR